MSKKDVESTYKPFTFLYDVLYPACALFAAIVFGAFTSLFLLGYNVTETRDSYISKQNDDTEDFTNEWLIGDEYSLSLPMLIGIFLFCLSVFAMFYVYRLGFDKISARLLHFFGTLLSFFICVLTFSGYISYAETSFGSIVLSLALVSILYFVCVGIKKLFTPLISKTKSNSSGTFSTAVRRYIAPSITFFAFSVLLCAILAYFLPVNVKVNLDTSWDPDAQRTIYESYDTIITPLAPTLQNYLRYLGSALFLIIGFSFLTSKLPAIARWSLNFLTYFGGFTAMWLIQLDMFKELESSLLYAVIAFIAVYLLFAIFMFIRSDFKKDEGDYDAQFSAHKHKND